jgi:hypothetical protein
MTLKVLKITLILFGALFSLCTGSLAEEANLSFDIPSQDVVPALDQFARLTNLSLIYKAEDIRSAVTQELSGTYLPDQALHIMLAGTGLGFKKTGLEAIAIVKVCFSFDIPSQNLVAALQQFGIQTDLSLAYRLEDIDTIESCVVSGTYSPDQALRIMLEGTGLSFKKTGEETFAVVRAPVSEEKPKIEELLVTPDAKASKNNEGG